MHRQRWVSGLIIAPAVILYVLFSPPWLFLLLLLGLIYLGQKEYYALSLPQISGGQRGIGLLLSLLIPLSFYASPEHYFLVGVSLAFLGLIILALKEKKDFAWRLELMQKMLLGIFYVPFFLGFFLLIYRLEQGRLWILFTLTAAYAGDISAFYIGRSWGQKKLAPLISPGKTVAGGWGAVGGSLAGAALFKFFFIPNFPFWMALAMGGGVGILGQTGDIFESLLKRNAQVKDSGSLIPGHGGILDRIDSILLGAPWVYFWVKFWG